MPTNMMYVFYLFPVSYWSFSTSFPTLPPFTVFVGIKLQPKRVQITRYNRWVFTEHTHPTISPENLSTSTLRLFPLSLTTHLVSLFFQDKYFNAIHMYFISASLNYNWQIIKYLMCKLWWFDTCIHCEKRPLSS